MSAKHLSLSFSVLSFALLAPLGACNTDHATQPGKEDGSQLTLITTLLVSAPSKVTAAQQLQLSIGSTEDDSYAYISASPGTAPGVTASIMNRTRDRQSGTAESVRATIEDGGFDPVRVRASMGDTLQIAFLSPDGSPVLVGAAVVPRVRPPTIVRTNPRPGKKDVPLNSRFEIVFSEPIDPASINSQNIRVLTGGAGLDGSLVQLDAFTVSFVPAKPLSPSTLFQLVIGTGVHNLGGVGLESELSIQFETGASSSDPGACTTDTECISFIRRGSIYTTALLRSGTAGGSVIAANGAALLPMGFAVAEPVWSPDGRQLAFVDWSRTKLCVAGQTGSGTKCRNVFSDHRPSWSPDGSQLAFVGSLQPDNPNQAGPRQLFVLKLSDMSLRVVLDNVGTFCGASVSWSPDGSRIAFTSLPSMCGILATVRVDGSDLHVVQYLNPAQPIRSIAWSPDGQRFAVLGVYEIATVNVDGTGWQVLVTASSLQSAEIMEAPTWLTDGSAILFSAGWNCFMGCSDNRIMFVTRDGSQGTVLLNAAEPAVRPPIR